LLFTLRAERPTTQSSYIIKSSFTQPTNEVDSIIHETDTTTKPFPSTWEVVTPSRKTITIPQPTTRKTTTATAPQPTTRRTTTIPQPTTRRPEYLDYVDVEFRVPDPS